MEFATLGAHCTVATCKIRDFLPFECDCCRRVFCLEHRTYTAHQCPNSGLKDCVSFKCPLCSKTVALMANQNANEVWEIHSATECDPSKRKTKKPRCSVPGCREVMGPSNRSVCESCRKEVCLKHRFPDKHECVGRRGLAAKAANARRGGGAEEGGITAWAQGMLGMGPTGSGGGQRGPSPVSGSSSSSRAAAPARPRTAPNPPDNSVMGSAARRRRSGDDVAAASTREVIDLTGDATPPPVSAPSGRVGGGNEVDTACPFCGLVEPDPVALVTHVESVHAEQSAGQQQASGGEEGCSIA